MAISFYEAREQWAKMSTEERKALIEKLRGDAKYASGHDWAGLPPEARTAIMETLEPETAPAAEETTEADDSSHSSRRRGR